jgi:hypothetical protein
VVNDVIAEPEGREGIVGVAVRERKITEEQERRWARLPGESSQE